MCQQKMQKKTPALGRWDNPSPRKESLQCLLAIKGANSKHIISDLLVVFFLIDHNNTEYSHSYKSPDLFLKHIKFRSNFPEQKSPLPNCTSGEKLLFISHLSIMFPSSCVMRKREKLFPNCLLYAK